MSHDRKHAHLLRKPILACLLVFGWATAVSVPAFAQDSLPDASNVENVQPTDLLSEDMKESEGVYKKLREPLKPKQKSILEELENAYLLTLAPEMEVARLSWELKNCTYEDKSKKQEDASIFAAFRLEKKREAQTQMEEAALKFKNKTDFIDPAVLTRHLAVIMHFGKQVSLDALRAQMAVNDPASKAMQCKQGQTTLLAYREK